MKYMKVFLIGACVVIGVLFFVKNPLRLPTFLVKQYLFLVTPKDAHFYDVKFIVTENKKWTIVAMSENEGFWDLYSRPPTALGSKYIWVYLGKYRNILFNLSVFACWIFNEKSELIDIRVDKELDAL